jgi:D-glycero-D-manno-heptose 1,7-bisphosphate phosphatase
VEKHPGKKTAVFLDRDGTINVDKGYLHRVEDFEFISGAPQAIARLNAAGFVVLVVSNQAGIARGYFEPQAVEILHEYLQSELAHFGAHIDGFYFCPHHPTEGQGQYRRDCDCRKGKPGLLLQAAEEHDIDLAQSYMVGDKASDVEAGVAAGCTSLLVLTGYGCQVSEEVVAKVSRFANLAAAVDFILKHP